MPTAAELMTEVQARRDQAMGRLATLAEARRQKLAKMEKEAEIARRESEDALKQQASGWYGTMAGGAAAGAGIGTAIAPGLGTGIGAGIGALAGAGLGIWGETQRRKDIDKILGKKTKGMDYLGRTLGRAPTIEEAGQLFGGIGSVAGHYQKAGVAEQEGAGVTNERAFEGRGIGESSGPSLSGAGDRMLSDPMADPNLRDIAKVNNTAAAMMAPSPGMDSVNPAAGGQLPFDSGPHIPRGAEVSAEGARGRMADEVARQLLADYIFQKQRRVVGGIK